MDPTLQMKKKTNPVELAIESFLYRSRWLLAPFYIGLVVAIAILLLKFTQELWHLLPNLWEEDFRHVLLIVLKLVDIALIADLLLLVIFSGYENFVSRIDVIDEDRPRWMGKITFSGIKIKLFGSIVAISGIELLKVFMQVEEYTQEQVLWLVLIHITFVVSGLLFSLMDKLAAQTHLLEEEERELFHRRRMEETEAKLRPAEEVQERHR